MPDYRALPTTITNFGYVYLNLQLASINVENEEPNRRDWRELLLTAPGLGSYISGVVCARACSLGLNTRSFYLLLHLQMISRAHAFVSLIVASQLRTDATSLYHLQVLFRRLRCVQRDVCCNPLYACLAF